MATFTHAFRARWVDMDFNQHMRNAAYLGCAEDTRMLFMEAGGWSMADFQASGLGPVVLEDRITYKRELKLLDAFTVDLQVAAATEDFGRLKVRNRFFRADDQGLCATVESVVLWFDLKQRRPGTPPERLAAVWKAVDRAEDFETWAAKAR